MNILDQIEQNGLRIIDGKRRLLAALEAGYTVTANGDDGKSYSISMQQDTVSVVEVPNEQVGDAGLKFDGIFLPIGSLSADPTIVRATAPKKT